MVSRVDLRATDTRSQGTLAGIRGQSDASDAPDARDESQERARRETVREIIERVRADGDAALRELTERFDGCRIGDLRVPADEVAAARAALAPDLADALERAATRIRAYHERQGATPPPDPFDADGIRVRERVVPVARAGLYVPGGRAVYPSSVLMTAIPARVAGVERIALCVPPGPDGAVPQVTLAAAAIAGVDEVYRVGGAQAIAALAYGTASIAPVDVIVGPGNAYVSLAKREVAGAGVVGIESPAGPSELVVVADAGAPPEAIALDLAAQAEHGPDGMIVLVTWAVPLADAVERALDEITAGTARADEIADALREGGRIILVRDAEAAMDVANALAPEHLELMVADPEPLVDRVLNAGAVFTGYDGATAIGDYFAGANHVLPTGRASRFASALRVDDFRKHIHVVDVSHDGVLAAADAVATIATAEGLVAHAASVTSRAQR